MPPFNHHQGEEFKPSAYEFNAFGEAALQGRRRKASGDEGVQSGYVHSGKIWVQVTDQVDVNRFDFVILDEPLFLPENSDEAEEMVNRIIFKASIPTESETWWDIYAQYKHCAILQAGALYEDNLLIPAVADGLSWCKLGFLDPGSDKFNSRPTTAWPTNEGRAVAGTGYGHGPLKIVWMEDEDNDDGFRWCLVKVASDFRLPIYVRGNASDDADKGTDVDVDLETPLGDITTVSATAKWFDVTDGDLVGLTWCEATSKYDITAIECPTTGGGGP